MANGNDNGNGNGNGQSLPESIPLSDIENLQSISNNLTEIKAKFLDPIDRMRSEYLNGRSTGEAQESRCHAYYRWLGMPVVRANGTFYNPGYNPPLGRPPDRTKDAGNDVDEYTLVDPVTLDIENKRETEYRKRRTIFKWAGMESTVYALALGVADGMKDFYIEDPEQSFTKADRKTVLSSMYTDVYGERINSWYETGNHIIRPFTTNPAIIVMPKTRHVCQPFVKDKFRIYEGKGSVDTKLKRPGLEVILRYRLRDESDSTAYQDALVALATSAPSATNALSIVGLTRADLSLVNLALNERDVVDDDEALALALEALTSYELININGLVKIIKSLIDILAESFKTIEDVAKHVSWIPLPDRRGPEYGSRPGNYLYRTVGRSQLEKQLSTLKIKSTENIPTIGSDIAIDDLAVSPFIYNPGKKKYDNQIQDVADAITEWNSAGSRALSNIEIITGEISGFGLIDIMAMLVALWSVEERVLISLLDDEAFDRLYENKDLRSGEVELRKEGGGAFYTVTEALEELEKKVNNVLDFADLLFENKKKQNEGEGGEPARS